MNPILAIVVLCVVGAVLYAIYWLTVNLVLPLLLLNSALWLVVWAAFSKQRRVVLSIVAFAGGLYMLYDISRNWLSGNFVENVVRDAFWIDLFVWVNAAALGVAAWFLTSKLWKDARAAMTQNPSNSKVVMGVVISAIALPLVLFPLIHHVYLKPDHGVPVTMDGNTVQLSHPRVTTTTQQHTPTQQPTNTPITETRILTGHFTQASSRPLTAEELSVMDRANLRIMRNEIFARYGYIFKDGGLRAHFEQQSWYKPTQTDVTHLLTDLEKQNIGMIELYE